jgi:hypothetical protein
MKISFLPKTLLGWWSVGLVAASLILFVVSVVILGPRPDYVKTLAYTLTTIIAGVSLANFAAGLVAILKRKDRSVIVFASIFIGVYTLFECLTSLLGLQKIAESQG